jgi:hypothetical protein
METQTMSGTDTAPAVERADISDLPREEWLETLEDVTEEAGYFVPIGDHHCAIFSDASTKLLVTFETFESITERSENGLPLGYNLAEKNGWSHLGVIAHDNSNAAPWFRAAQVFEYMDRLVDSEFFEDFDQVVFYGAGPCGYAASAFSVASPGATVIAVAPQATLNPRLASWDPRFPQTRRVDFSTRYGFAPDMIDAAARGLILFDPKITHDAMHAALFNRPHVSLRACPYFGADPEFEMIEMGVIAPLLEAAMMDELTERAITRALRNRRTHLGYLRRLLGTMDPTEAPLQTAMLCSHVLAFADGWRFKRAFNTAQEVLTQQGRANPWKGKSEP